MPTDELLESIDRLFSILHERRIEYLLVGGIALLNYIKGRNTEDIDLIMSIPSLGKIPEIQVTGREDFFVRCKFGDLKIDVLATDNPLFKKVLREYSSVQRFSERDIPCATVDGLLLLKLYALPSLYRQGLFGRVSIYENDIAMMIHDYKSALEPLFSELALHVSSTDLAAVREVVNDILRRIERFPKAFHS